MCKVTKKKTILKYFFSSVYCTSAIFWDFSKFLGSLARSTEYVHSVNWHIALESVSNSFFGTKHIMMISDNSSSSGLLVFQLSINLANHA